MLLLEARDLVDGSYFYTKDAWGSLNRTQPVMFLGGPFEQDLGMTRNWFIVGRASDDTVNLYDISICVPKPKLPEKGETWIKKNGTRTITRYIDEVTDRYVVTKSYNGRPDTTAHLTDIKTFVKDYKFRSR